MDKCFSESFKCSGFRKPLRVFHAWNWTKSPNLRSPQWLGMQTMDKHISFWEGIRTWCVLIYCALIKMRRALIILEHAAVQCSGFLPPWALLSVFQPKLYNIYKADYNQTHVHQYRNKYLFFYYIFRLLKDILLTKTNISNYRKWLRFCCERFSVLWRHNAIHDITMQYMTSQCKTCRHNVKCDNEKGVWSLNQNSKNKWRWVVQTRWEMQLKKRFFANI